MKKIILLLAMGVALTTQTLFAQVPSYVPTNGLVGYWPFSGNSNDVSTNANNGIANGATLTTDRFGNVDSAYNFIQGNTINIPNSLSIDNINLASVNIWFKTNTTTNSQLFKKGNSLTESTAEQISIQLNYNGINETDVSAKYNSSCVPGNGWVDTFNTTISVNNNVWHMLTAVIDSNSLKCFIDGVLVSSTLAPNVNMDVCNGGGIILGKNWNSDLDYYNGIMDDIGFWNRALTQQEITNLFNANQCITNITVTDTLIVNVGQLSFNDPVTWANNITISPNPASSEININFNNVTNLNGGTLKVINSLGQEVATTPITTSGTNSTMQLATWGGTGMYFVQIINPQGQIVDIKKIILQ